LKKKGRFLKGQLLASVAVVALIVAGPAAAADLPLKAPPQVAPWTWSGFYLGGRRSLLFWQVSRFRLAGF
jgi:hypothetical protein